MSGVDTTSPAARKLQADTVMQVEKMPPGGRVIVGLTTPANVKATLTSSPPVTLEPDWRDDPETIARQQRRDEITDWIARVSE